MSRKPSPAKQAKADRLHLRDCAVRNPSTAFGALVPMVSLCLQCRDIERWQREARDVLPRVAVKLYLDDVRNPPDDSWTVVRSAEEAKALLAAGGVEHASLDYDLGECDACKAKSPTPGLFYPFTCEHRLTGYELVKWMAETGTWPKHKPTVHSTTPNREGRAAMVAVIERNFRGHDVSKVVEA